MRGRKLSVSANQQEPVPLPEQTPRLAQILKSSVHSQLSPTHSPNPERPRPARLPPPRRRRRRARAWHAPERLFSRRRQRPSALSRLQRCTPLPRLRAVWMATPSTHGGGGGNRADEAGTARNGKLGNVGQNWRKLGFRWKSGDILFYYCFLGCINKLLLFFRMQ